MTNAEADEAARKHAFQAESLNAMQTKAYREFLKIKFSCTYEADLDDIIRALKYLMERCHDYTPKTT